MDGTGLSGWDGSPADGAADTILGLRSNSFMQQ
jgi:hypothetical protein